MLERSHPNLWQNLIAAMLVWALSWGLMFWLDGRVDLTNLSMLLVLAAAIASLWLPVLASICISLVSVLVFNWAFVPPRGSFAVDVHQHALLLISMLALSWITAALMSRLRWQAEAARQHARRAEQLRTFSDHLRDSESLDVQARALVDALQPLSIADVQLMLLKDPLAQRNDAESLLVLGQPDADQYEGLWACLRGGKAFGPGTGRHEDLAAWYLPLRGRNASHGAALLSLSRHEPADPQLRAEAQSLCDQMGLALERLVSEQAAQRAHDEAEGQATRNALLAAISHDYRTPLATIMSAASSLQDQDARLSPAQRLRLSSTILDETRQLSRMTDNTLQLARLDAPGVELNTDWESAEEIVGAVLSRVRARRVDGSGPRLRARLEPNLPLLRCDALLLTQLLENLVDNAFKYAGEGNVELLVRRDAAHLVLAVRDRGPGVAPDWRDRIFAVFQRGAELDRARPDGAQRRGAGVGLAACRAIARAHGGEMRLRARSHGGASFECWLPLGEPPQEDSA